MNIKNFCTLVAASALGVAIYEGAKSTTKYFGKAWAARRVASDNNEDEDAPAVETPKPEEKKPAGKDNGKKDGQQGKKDGKPAGKQDDGKKPEGDKKPEGEAKK